jgi:hypothetical protein
MVYVDVFVLGTFDHVRKECSHAIIKTHGLIFLVACNHITDLLSSLGYALVVRINVLSMHTVSSSGTVAHSNLLLNKLVVYV